MEGGGLRVRFLRVNSFQNTPGEHNQLVPSSVLICGLRPQASGCHGPPCSVLSWCDLAFLHLFSVENGTCVLLLGGPVTG